MQCPRCQHENPPQAKFCLECGARFAVGCAQCSAQLPAGAKFCLECGRPTDSQELEPARITSPQSYTPRHLAEKILTSRAALEGERKQITVLFADLKGSMELLGDRDPEEARKLLDPVLEQMMQAVHRYEGTVNQVMGDGIMALFGAPLAHEDHAVRACYAALRMQEAVKGYADGVRREHGAIIRIRVGLNSGEVIVRAIGSDLRMDYSAVGQTTHLAARMEQLAEPGSTLLTAETLTLAEGFVQVTSLGPMAVKGLPALVEVYELAGVSAVRSRLQAAAARGLSRFVGRDAEVEQLRRALVQARQGRGQVVAVVGEPGVGKSRLTFEVTHSHRVGGWLVLEAGSVSYGKATSYLPVIDLLRGYFHIGDRDTPREIREKVTGKTLTLDRALEATLPALLALLDLAGDDAQWQALDPTQRRQRMLNAVKRLLLHETRVQPLLVVFEDLHWIDPETQELLDGLVESLPPARLLLLVNYRPEYEHRWGSKTSYTQIRLDPLLPESALALLHGLLGEDSTVEPLKSLLIERTEGNPLFIEESVRTLIETGALLGERGAHRLAQAPSDIQVPPTVQAIIAARIDRLTPEDKRLLQSAAVIGKDVPFALLAAIADMREDDLRGGLAHLLAAEFLYETSLFPDLEYTFKHALTHEVTYGSVLQERRRALHASIVTALETRHPGAVTEQLERLAQHALRGALWEKAVGYLRQAGVKAAARSATHEAVTLFEQALTVLAQRPETRDTLTEVVDIRLALGPALMTIKGPAHPDVETSYIRAQEVCARLEDTSRLFPVVWGLWYGNLLRGEFQAARQLGERLLGVARGSQAPALLLEAHHSLWATLFAMGDAAAARTHQEAGLRLYDPEQHHAQASLYGGHDAGVCCRIHSAMTLWHLGYPDQALTRAQEALGLARKLSHPLTTVHAHYYAASLHYHRGERHAAEENAEAAVTLATAQGLSAWAEYGSILLARLMVAQGRWQEGMARLQRGVASIRGVRGGWREKFSLCLLMEASAAVRQAESGLQALSAMTEDNIESVYEPEFYRLEGELRLDHATGVSPDQEAEACFRRAIDMARHRQGKSLELRAVTSVSRLLDGQGRRDEARRMLAETYGWFTEGFDTGDLREARALLDHLS